MIPAIKRAMRAVTLTANACVVKLAHRRRRLKSVHVTLSNIAVMVRRVVLAEPNYHVASRWLIADAINASIARNYIALEVIE
jgi:hypothetical protein